MHFRVSFEKAIHDELVSEVEKGAAYATPRLQRFRVAPDRRSAYVECEDGAEVEVAEKVRRHVAAMVATFRPLGEPEELARTARRDERPITADAESELHRRGWVRPLGRGQVALSGGALALRRSLDEAVADLARRRFDAQEQDYPALLEPDVLARAGYLGSFPHSVCLVSHLTEDFDAIEAFRRANAESGSLVVTDAATLVCSDAALRPAVCLPVYRAYEGVSLPPAGLAITTTGKAFRYESKNLEGLRRLWDFSMREIVFLAPPDVIERRRAEVVLAVTSLMQEWDLECRIVSASDPFFATVRGTKALWQRSREAKYEVLVDVGAGPIAVGSINLAGNLFGHAFGIRTAAGEVATTACVGFGLERLVLALFSQHGFESSRWPRPMREVVFG